MLSKPHAGWTIISIGKFSDRASFLTDVPMDLLDGFINNEHNCFCVKFDAEGWDYIIVFDNYGTDIISDRHIDFTSEYHYRPSKVYKKDLALEVANDVEAELEGWTDWLPNVGNEDLSEREKELRSKIAKVREIYSTTPEP